MAQGVDDHLTNERGVTGQENAVRARAVAPVRFQNCALPHV